MSDKTDFLVIGGGLAGILLEAEIRRRGYRTVLIDQSRENVSSVIAAGIVNPITGKYFSLSWRSEDFFPILATFYNEWEQGEGKSFFHSMPILRVLSSHGDENTWLSKAGRTAYKPFFRPLDEERVYLKSALTMLHIRQGGYLNIAGFVGNAREKLNDYNIFREEEFEHGALDMTAKRYKDLDFEKVVFCEGYRAIRNPYFEYLPFTPNKGELLEIECKDLAQDEILVGSVFILPVGDQRFKVGATYDHFDLSHQTTLAKRGELQARLDKMIDMDYTIVNHWYGIRPAVKDRRPLLGQHPEQPDMYIFNGLGSKAASMAPVLAKEMAEHMINGGSLHPEADIERFNIQ